MEDQPENQIDTGACRGINGARASATESQLSTDQYSSTWALGSSDCSAGVVQVCEPLSKLLVSPLITHLVVPYIIP